MATSIQWRQSPMRTEVGFVVLTHQMSSVKSLRRARSACHSYRDRSRFRQRLPLHRRWGDSGSSNGRTTACARVERLPEHHALVEDEHAPLDEDDVLPRLRVAASTRAFVAEAEGAEASDLHLLPPAEHLLHRLEDLEYNPSARRSVCRTNSARSARSARVDAPVGLPAIEHYPKPDPHRQTRPSSPSAEGMGGTFRVASLHERLCGSTGTDVGPGVWCGLDGSCLGGGRRQGSTGMVSGVSLTNDSAHHRAVGVQPQYRVGHGTHLSRSMSIRRSSNDIICPPRKTPRRAPEVAIGG